MKLRLYMFQLQFRFNCKVIFQEIIDGQYNFCRQISFCPVVHIHNLLPDYRYPTLDQVRAKTHALEVQEQKQADDALKAGAAAEQN